jgi:hypothetical protein
VHHKKTLLLNLIFVLILSSAFNAWANPPYSETSYFDDDFPIVECGDYEVWTAATTRMTETTFFDRNDNPVRVRVSFHISDSIYYNSEYPDIYIQQGASGTGENIQIKINLVTGEEQYTGSPYRITLPGIGVLYKEAGRAYWDGENMFFTGSIIFPEAGTGSALCDALAP